MRADADPASYAYYAEAVEDDIFEWHFAIFGPEDSEFEGGVYHGRILLPTEYPFKPPSFMLLTPSGEGRCVNFFFMVFGHLSCFVFLGQFAFQPCSVRAL